MKSNLPNFQFIVFVSLSLNFRQYVASAENSLGPSEYRRSSIRDERLGSMDSLLSSEYPWDNLKERCVALASNNNGDNGPISSPNTPSPVISAISYRHSGFSGAYPLAPFLIRPRWFLDAILRHPRQSNIPGCDRPTSRIPLAVSTSSKLFNPFQSPS